MHGGRLVRPDRRVGAAVAHDNAVVHSVSRLTAGVRYTLLVVFSICEVCVAVGNFRVDWWVSRANP